MKRTQVRSGQTGARLLSRHRRLCHPHPGDPKSLNLSVVPGRTIMTPAHFTVRVLGGQAAVAPSSAHRPQSPAHLRVPECVPLSRATPAPSTHPRGVSGRVLAARRLQVPGPRVCTFLRCLSRLGTCAFPPRECHCPGSPVQKLRGSELTQRLILAGLPT